MFKHKIESRRSEVLLIIRTQKQDLETMVQRTERAGEPPDVAFLTQVRGNLTQIEQRTMDAKSTDELDDLVDDAEQQGQLRAYICPVAEIEQEGSFAIDVMEEWNVPKSAISKLRESTGQKLKSQDPNAARSALRTIFEEQDSWNGYTQDFEDSMRRYAVWLIVGSILFIAVAALAFHFRRFFVAGLILAGAAGSCVSVVSKMPLPEVSLSGEFEAYKRKILTRLTVGAFASLVGCALLGWGILPISINGQSFSDVLAACSTPEQACGVSSKLILFAVPIMFGFSERALTSFEQTFLGTANTGKRRR
jgi:hypothetical protein